jgi:hypothetical protein
VAWKSPPMGVITMGYSDIISVCIHARNFVYCASCAFVCSYGI